MAITLTEGQSTVTLEKDKDARRDYRFSLAEILPPNDPLKTITFSPAAGVIMDGVDFNDTDVVVWFSSGTPDSWYITTASYETMGGFTDQFIIRLFIKQDAELDTDLGSALFPNKFVAVAQLRRDNLMLLAQNYGLGDPSSEYLWGKLKAAEAELSTELRVRFAPTTFFPDTPTQEQINALAGQPWDVDPAYDYDPELFQSDKWGFIATRQAPIISVQRLRYAYPTADQTVFDIPLPWLKMDRKYGQIRIVPTAGGSTVLLNTYLLQLLGAGRVIPHMLQLTYVAGLENAARDYPQLVDAVKKLAVLKVIEDTFVPQSGSISADGLSQSVSTDMSKYQDTIDRIVNGAPGANGGLMAAIHGVRLAVM